jgi:intracellular sulfur oxidation DsrE/DsrF family protein
MFETESSIDRRGFLGAIVAGAAAAGLARIPGALAAEGMDLPVAASEPLDAALKKLSTRKYRQVFDAPRPNESMPVIWSWALLHTFNKLKVEDSNVGCFVVLRHEAIPFAMQDAVWAKYKLGEVFKIDDKTTKAPAVRNVVANVKPEDLPIPEMALEKVQARGVVFGVCDLAMTVYSMQLAAAANMKPEDVKKDLVANLLPGIVVLPSGVYGVHRAQSAGFTYCFAG